MSRIFEALQHSESELTGKDLREACDTAADLLRAAENRIGNPVAERAIVHEQLDNCERVTDLIPGFEQQVTEKPIIRSVPPAKRLHSLVTPDSRLISDTEAWSLGAEKFRLLALRLQRQDQAALTGSISTSQCCANSAIPL